MVCTWEADEEHEKDLENPYEYVDAEAETMADVMKQISEEDHDRVVNKGAAALQVNPAAFLLAGIEIEESQEAVILEIKRRNLTTIQATALQQQWTLLLGKICKLHDIQGQYMPGLLQWVVRQYPPLLPRNSAKPETIKIFLPSSVPTANREAVCAPGLVAQEDRLCKAQAEDTLCDLRRGLRTQIFAHKLKRQHLSGQGMYTKSCSLLDGIEAGIRVAAGRYRAARAALLALRAPGDWERVLQVLWKEDIRGMNERLMTEEEKEDNKRARVLAGLLADGKDNELDIFGELEEPMRGSDEMEDGILHPDIRVEWMKARAQVDRWREELILVEEEMRHVLEFCRWKAWWWHERIEVRGDMASTEITPALAEGLSAYVHEQIPRKEAWLAAWGGKWEKVRARTEIILHEHLVDVAEEVLVPMQVELDDDEEGLSEDDGFEEDD
ncbi:hypothetical protein C8R45DRAFT_1100033 [Mycena sanguinolenta]|nr:hypothetical protein C8R45DRAFT_1100033 [Mycena sanguinolenta]